jgi:hypothetical protein
MAELDGLHLVTYSGFGDWDDCGDASAAMVISGLADAHSDQSAIGSILSNAS